MRLIKKVLRFFIPQKVVNTFYHLPKAVLANIWHGLPGRKLTVIGVTGTDGKTTTVNMIYHILSEAGEPVSMVSTVYAAIGKSKIETGLHVTSPDPFTVQKLLRKAVKAGSKYAVLEITSHALDQHRFLGVPFYIGVITNITHEHLDYHKNWENYFKTKAKLIKNAKIAILNREEKHYDRLRKLSTGRVFTFGFSKTATFNPHSYPVRLSIPGKFNVANALAAEAVCSLLKIPQNIVKRSLANFSGIPGRMQKVKNKKGLQIVIDFAHTPNGLQNALTALKSDRKGKIISLIGAEGQRDIKKRPLLGEIAQKLSDFVIITAVDPRGEIDIINRQVQQGAQRAGGVLEKNLFLISDRQQAIDFAINTLANKGDSVGIFGKGHETSMNLNGKKEIPWSDDIAVQKALNG